MLFSQLPSIQESEDSTEVLLEIQADSSNRIAQIHISCFNKLQALFLETRNHLRHSLQKSIHPSFHFLWMSLSHLQVQLTRQLGSDPHTYHQPLTHLPQCFCQKDLYQRNKLFASQWLNFSQYLTQNPTEHDISTYQEVRKKKTITGRLHSQDPPSFPQSFCFPWWSTDPFLSPLWLLFLALFLSVFQRK